MLFQIQIHQMMLILMIYSNQKVSMSLLKPMNLRKESTEAITDIMEEKVEDMVMVNIKEMESTANTVDMRIKTKNKKVVSITVRNIIAISSTHFHGCSLGQSCFHTSFFRRCNLMQSRHSSRSLERRSGDGEDADNGKVSADQVGGKENVDQKWLLKFKLNRLTSNNPHSFNQSKLFQSKLSTRTLL